MPPSAPSPNNSSRSPVLARVGSSSPLDDDDEAKKKKAALIAESAASENNPAADDSAAAAAANNSALLNSQTANSLLVGGLNNNALSPYFGNALLGGLGGGGAGGMYGAMGGAGMYGGGGYGMMGMPPYGGGPMTGVTQALLGVQNVIFSLGQAVQIVGMNAEAVKHLLESAVSMLDHAVATWREMRVLEAEYCRQEQESEAAKKRRRRLRALRWALTASVAYAGYAVVRKLLQSYCSRRARRQPTAIEGGGPYHNNNNNYQQYPQQQHQPSFYNYYNNGTSPPTYGGYGSPSYPSAFAPPAVPFNNHYGGGFI